MINCIPPWQQQIDVWRHQNLSAVGIDGIPGHIKTCHTQMSSIIHKKLCKQTPVTGHSELGQALFFHINELTCTSIGVTRISFTKKTGKVKRKAGPMLNYLSTMQWRRMGECRYSSTILDLATRWNYVVSSTTRPLYPRERAPMYP
jgi:hypothetical protein